jgi:predicted nucleic acid-binding protein
LGSLGETLGPKIYLDANFFIYALEEIAPWAGMAKQILAFLDRGLCAAVTSELSLAECLQRSCSSFLTNDSRLKIPGLQVLGWHDLETFVAE